jgi:hypothetical protein
MEAVALSESFSELVGPGEVAPLNRDKERSLKLSTDNLCGCNLLPKDLLRAALLDEPVELGPEVAMIGGAFALARTRERLAGTTSRPNRSVVRPAGEAQGIAPASNAGEEMTLGIAANVVCSDIYDAPLVYVAISNQPGFD